MFKPNLKRLRLAAAILGVVAAPAALRAEATKVEPEEHPIQFDWSFAGVMGRYDQAQLKRGFKIYREVCSNCHSMQLVAFRSLQGDSGLGFSEEEVKSLASSYKIKDGPNDKGEYFERPGRPSDYFPSPFANEQAARTALNGGYPPDMSVLAKARGYHRGFPTFLLDAFPGLSYQEAGVDYIASLLQGYRDAPKDMTLPDGQFYNIYMPGRRIGMIPPLADGAVTYDDGAPQTVSQYAKDVSGFLMWAAEPHLDQRKSIGRGVLAFLLVFAVLLYFVKREIWSDVDH